MVRNRLRPLFGTAVSMDMTKHTFYPTVNLADDTYATGLAISTMLKHLGFN